MQTPTGEVVSDAPLHAGDEERVLKDISPTFSTSIKDLPETEIAIPEEAADLPRKIVKEGELVSFPNLRATDPDGDPIQYAFTSPLNEQGMWQTKEGDAGAYRVKIVASDGKSRVEQELLIIVEGKNKPPYLADLADIRVKEGERVEITPIISDDDQDPLKVTYTGWISTPQYQTTENDAGIHVVTITVSDGIHEVKKDVKIIVGNQNRAPMLQALEPVTIKEYDNLIVEPTATDPDGDKVSIQCGLPLTPQCTWQTKKGDAKTYRATITASDGTLQDQEELIIVVQSTNQPPVITGPEEIIVIEGETVTLDDFLISDPDEDEVLVSYDGWMKTKTRETDYTDAGTHTVFISASDGKDVVKHILTIEVKERNRAPVFTAGAFE